MTNYYLDSRTQTNGDHEVHTEDCKYLPSQTNRILLGDFKNCKDAIASAKTNYRKTKINGCFYCANGCHKKD